MNIEELKKDFEEWNDQTICFIDEADMKTDFAMYLIKKYHSLNE